jgi:hypothetical protein
MNAGLRIATWPNLLAILRALKYNQSNEKGSTMTDINEIRQWLLASRGERLPDGSSKWLVIAQKSKVSIRTLTNICSETYVIPRQKTLRGLEAVRKRMAKK